MMLLVILYSMWTAIPFLLDLVLLCIVDGPVFHRDERRIVATDNGGATGVVWWVDLGTRAPRNIAACVTCTFASMLFIPVQVPVV